MRLALLLAVGFLFVPLAAQAACTLPTGVEGQILYNQDYKLVQFCDATNWVKLGGSTLDSRIGTLTANKWCAANAGGTGFDCTQNAPTAGITALTGDVTASGSGSVAATIAANAVTYAKMQNTSAASVLLGRGSASGAGAVQELTLGSGLSLSGTILSATASGTVSGTTNYVAKFTAATVIGNSQIFDNGTNVGIGTASPVVPLDTVGGEIRIKGGANFGTVAASGAGMELAYDTTAGEGLIIPYDRSGSAFKKMRIESSTLAFNSGSGNVGIGTSSPGYKLQVNGNSYFFGNLSVQQGSSTSIYGVATLNGGFGVVGHNTIANYNCSIGTDSYSIACAGPTAGISDERLKKDIQPLNQAEGLDVIMKIRPVHYRWRDEKMNKPHPNGEIGFIAQDVEKALPQLVSEIVQPKDAAIKTSDGKEKVLQYDRIIAPAVLAIQQLKADNDNQADEISELREEIEALKASIH